MDMKMVVIIVSATMIYTLSNGSVYACPGINGTSCCPGQIWDPSQNKCIPICENGYNGTNCSMKCPYPSYGQNCQSMCNYIDKACDHRNGCNRIKEDSPYVSVHFSSTTTFITTKQEIECKNFLMFATIGIIVVALIVVVLYIYTWMLERRLLASGSYRLHNENQ